MSALQTWMEELVNKAPSTRRKYRLALQRFCAFTQQSPDELLRCREAELVAEKPALRRGSERQLKKYIAHLAAEDASVSSQQVVYAAIRSFYEMHYMPLRMRRDDYPRGDSLGHRAITKPEIQRMLRKASVSAQALIHVLKDCGLRVSDVATLTVGHLQPGLQMGYEFIPVKLITQKNKVLAQTWIGPEAVDAIQAYLDHRRRGTRKIPPETITDTSPLFRTRGKAVTPLTRSGMSSAISHMASRIGLSNQVSAHGFRKYFQTRMESAGVNPDWIDHMVGRKLLGARGHYSLPEPRELFQAYQQGYDALRVQEAVATRSDIIDLKQENMELRRQIEAMQPAVALIQDLFRDFDEGAGRNDLVDTLTQRVIGVTRSQADQAKTLQKQADRAQVGA